MAVQRPVINTTTVAGLLSVVDANAQQQLADEALLATLQSQVTNLLSRSAAAPGSYSPPGAAGAQVYGANATPWVTAASQGAILAAAGTSNSRNYTFYDVWDAANLVDILVFNSTANGTTVARVQRYASGKAPTIIAQVSLVSSAYPNAGVVVVSAKTARISLNVTTASQAEYLVTWNGTSLTSATTANATTAATLASGSLYNRRAFLVGTASWIVLGMIPNYVSFCVMRKDRGSTALSDYQLASNNYGNQSAAATGGDQVGNGYFIRGIAQNTPADPTVRPAVVLEYVDDYQCQRIATLRITNTNFGGWLFLAMISPTLAIGQYYDATAANTFYTVAISVNIGNASPLGLYGPFVSGALGGGSNLMYGFYNATTLYVMDTLTPSTATPWTVKLHRIVFNSANTGSELTTATANDVTVTIANGLALTSQPIILYTAFYQDQLTVCYYGSTGTVSTTGVYIETFNLS